MIKLQALSSCEWRCGCLNTLTAKDVVLVYSPLQTRSDGGVWCRFLPWVSWLNSYKDCANQGVKKCVSNLLGESGCRSGVRKTTVLEGNQEVLIIITPTKKDRAIAPSFLIVDIYFRSLIKR